MISQANNSNRIKIRLKDYLSLKTNLQESIFSLQNPLGVSRENLLTLRIQP
jgi:hypothetical protein